jgi:hypothetical protein
VDEAEIGAAVVRLRGGEAQEHHVDVGGRLQVRVVETDETTFGGTFEEIGETLFEYGDFPGAQPGHPLGVGFTYPDPMSKVRQTGAGDQTDITGANDCYIHVRTS